MASHFYHNNSSRAGNYSNNTSPGSDLINRGAAFPVVAPPPHSASAAANNYHAQSSGSSSSSSQVGEPVLLPPNGVMGAGGASGNLTDHRRPSGARSPGVIKFINQHDDDEYHMMDSSNMSQHQLSSAHASGSPPSLAQSNCGGSNGGDAFAFSTTSTADQSFMRRYGAEGSSRRASNGEAVAGGMHAPIHLAESNDFSDTLPPGAAAAVAAAIGDDSVPAHRQHQHDQQQHQHQQHQASQQQQQQQLQDDELMAMMQQHHQQHGHGIYQPLTNLYVSNLSVAVDNDLLFSWFREYGPLVSACVMVDVHTGRSRGYGFVQFESETDGESALKGLNGRVMYVPQDRQTIVLRVQRSMFHKGIPSAPSATIFLRNIPNTYDSTRLLPILSQYGEVERIQLFSIFENPRLLKACIDFKTKGGALNAVNALHRKLLDPTCEVALAARFADQNRRLSETSTAAHVGSGGAYNSNGGGGNALMGGSVFSPRRDSMGYSSGSSRRDSTVSAESLGSGGSGSRRASLSDGGLLPPAGIVPHGYAPVGGGYSHVGMAPARHHPHHHPHHQHHAAMQLSQHNLQHQQMHFAQPQPQFVLVQIAGQPQPMAVPLNPNGTITLPPGFALAQPGAPAAMMAPPQAFMQMPQQHQQQQQPFVQAMQPQFGQLPQQQQQQQQQQQAFQSAPAAGAAGARAPPPPPPPYQPVQVSVQHRQLEAQ